MKNPGSIGIGLKDFGGLARAEHLFFDVFIGLTFNVPGPELSLHGFAA